MKIDPAEATLPELHSWALHGTLAKVSKLEPGYLYLRARYILGSYEPVEDFLGPLEHLEWIRDGELIEDDLIVGCLRNTGEWVVFTDVGPRFYTHLEVIVA